MFHNYIFCDILENKIDSILIDLREYKTIAVHKVLETCIKSFRYHTDYYWA